MLTSTMSNLGERPSLCKVRFEALRQTDCQ